MEFPETCGELVAGRDRGINHVVDTFTEPSCRRSLETTSKVEVRFHDKGGATCIRSCFCATARAYGTRKTVLPDGPTWISAAKAPLVYELEDDLKAIRSYYLGDQEAVEKAAKAVADQLKKS